MSDFSNLPSEERKKILAEKQEFLRKHMTPEEYADLLKRLDDCEIKIDPAIAGKSIDDLMEEGTIKPTRTYKRQKRKDEREWRREMRDKPVVLVFFAGIISKIFPVLMTVYTLVAVPVLYMAWKIYKLAATDGWQVIFHTQNTLYVVGYVVLFFILWKLNLAIYSYAND